MKIAMPKDFYPCMSTAPEENRDALFNLQTDPKQEHPIKDLMQEQHMIDLMCRLMQENDAPAEQYARIGLQQP